MSTTTFIAIVTLAVVLPQIGMAESVADGAYASSKEYSRFGLRALEVKGDTFKWYSDSDVIPRGDTGSSVVSTTGKLIKTPSGGIEFKVNEQTKRYEALKVNGTVVLFPSEEIEEYNKRGVFNISTILIKVGTSLSKEEMKDLVSAKDLFKQQPR